MIRLIFFTIFYLAPAFALEVAVEQQFQILAPPWLRPVFQLTLLALGSVLIGFLRGEIPGMCIALIAACLLGFSRDPGMLGAYIVSLSATAYLSGLTARHLRLQSWLSRWFFFSLLLLSERLIWYAVRCFFWPGNSTIEISFEAVALTALAGALLYGLIAPGLRANFIHADEN